jgi:hypothetical protein
MILKVSTVTALGGMTSHILGAITFSLGTDSKDIYSNSPLKHIYPFEKRKE